MTTYTSGLETHTLDLTADSLVYGTIYKLRYRASNVEGDGDYSDTVNVALNSLPVAPATPSRVALGSTETAITVSWDSSQLDPELEGNAITGYRLYAAREHSNIYELVYDGAGYPQVRSAVLSGLTPGDHYDFKVSAMNFNGEGPQSTLSLETYSCTAPTGMPAPVRVDATSTSTTTTLSWEEPSGNGGCPLTGYALYRSDPAQADPAGGTEVFVEVNSDNDSNIRNQPDLLEATVTFYDASSTGLYFKYYVEAINAIGGTVGTTAEYILATIPSAPSLAPIQVPSLTSSTQITVLLTELTTDSETGGAPIISYALQMSQNSADEAASFADVTGTLTDSLALQHTIYTVEKGLTYAFRYRTKNIYGWSEEWSPIVYEVSADVPDAPAAPSFVEASDTSVTLAISLPLDNGGQILTSIELWRDDGSQADNPTYTQVSTYDTTSFTLSHTPTVSDDGIETGKIYSFRTLGTNAKGSSEFSKRVQIAVSAPPSAPTTPTADYQYSSDSSIFVQWTANTDDPLLSPGGDITGYELLMATDETGEDYTSVFNSENLSTQVTEYLVGSPDFALTAGSNVRFKVIAYNFNGPSEASDIATFPVCGNPSGMAKPTKVIASTVTPSITVQWDEPSSNGGCPITGYVVYVDDGAGGSFVEANSDSDVLVRDLPSLRQLEITRVSTPGAAYRI